MFYHTRMIRSTAKDVTLLVARTQMYSSPIQRDAVWHIWQLVVFAAFINIDGSWILYVWNTLRQHKRHSERWLIGLCFSCTLDNFTEYFALSIWKWQRMFHVSYVSLRWVSYAYHTHTWFNIIIGPLHVRINGIELCSWWTEIHHQLCNF